MENQTYPRSVRREPDHLGDANGLLVPAFKKPSGIQPENYIQYCPDDFAQMDVFLEDMYGNVNSNDDFMRLFPPAISCHDGSFVLTLTAALITTNGVRMQYTRFRNTQGVIEMRQTTDVEQENVQVCIDSAKLNYAKVDIAKNRLFSVWFKAGGRLPALPGAENADAVALEYCGRKLTNVHILRADHSLIECQLAR